MIKLSNLLLELRTIYLSKSYNKYKYILQYKDKLFILDNNTSKTDLVNYVISNLLSHPAVNKLFSNEWWKLSRFNLNKEDIVHNILSAISEVAPDIIIADYYPSESTISIWKDTQPISSINIKKIAKQLKLKKIIINNTDYNSLEDIDISYTPKKLIGDIPPTFFHGTTSIYLENILKFGLKPDESPSNFSKKNIHHPDHIFLAATKEIASYYAYIAFHNNKNIPGNFPIILEVKIPDKNLLGPDYDYDINPNIEPHFPDKPFTPEQSINLKPLTMSKEIGKWSYKGRIPPSHIINVYYKTPSSWKKMSIPKLKKLLDKYHITDISYILNTNKLENIY